MTTTQGTDQTEKLFVHVRTGIQSLLLAAALVGNTTPSAADAGPSPATKAESIPWSQIGAKAGADYTGDGLAVTASPGGARLRCVFQRLEGEATTEGLWLSSTVTNQSNDRFRVMATAFGREGGAGSPLPAADGAHGVTRPTTLLPRTGTVEVKDKLARFIRPGLVEEYTVSMDGVRQDFVVLERPAFNPKLSTPNPSVLRVELAVTGARVQALADGAQLVLAQSGRKIAYYRLRVTDATGRELSARMESLDSNDPGRARLLPSRDPKEVSARQEPRPTTLAVLVDDTDATYPIRIDPTFSDANWISMGGLPGANGDVFAAAVDGSGNIYLGGFFIQVGGVQVNYIAKWNGTNWSALGSGMNGWVHALAVSGSNLYAGGSFTMAGDTNANRIAKWDGSSWSALGSGVDNSVDALAVSGGDLYAGGVFATAGGVDIGCCIARWNGTNWSALGSGMDHAVSALAVSGGNLYAGGGFAMAGGVDIGYGIARWNGTNWSALGLGMDGWVYALVVSGGDLYAGGYFSTAGDTNANCIARWNGSRWNPLGLGMSGGVHALAASGTSLYVGGGFTIEFGGPGNRIAKWDGSGWTTLGSGMNSGVFALSMLGGNLYAGGMFSTAGGVDIGYGIAKWDGSSWKAPGLGVNNYVIALAVSGSDLYAGGGFTRAGDSNANYVAKWDGSSWSALGSGMNAPVYALAASGSDLYAGGDFTTAGDTNANYIAKWDGTNWSALGSGMDGGVTALAVSGSDLYAGGYFATAGGVETGYGIARWDGTNWSALGSGMGGDYPYVYALAVAASDLYAGGEFTTAGNTNANYIAKWDGTNWSALGSGMDGGVVALAVSGPDVYAGGGFTRAGDANANNIAKWNGSSWSALGSGMDSGVHSLAVAGGDLYAGGYFTTAGGVEANSIARWTGIDWIALGSGTDGGVHALAASGSHLYVGGDFTTAGDKVSHYVARADLVAYTGPTDITLSGNTIAEGLPPDSPIGLFGAINPDPEDAHTFALVSGEGDVDNGAFTLAGNELRSTYDFDFETQNSLSVRVRATDAEGWSIERVFAISVLDQSLPPVITWHPENLTIQRGGTAEFFVGVVGDEPLSFQWFIHTAAIAGATNQSHSVSNVQVADIGAYHVVVSNAFGMAVSSSAWLTVDRTPAVSSNCHPIANTAQPEFARKSAFDGTNFLIGVRGSASSANAVGVQFMSPDGTRVGPLLTNGWSVGRVAGGNVFHAAPWVTFGTTNYLMVWTDADHTNDAYAQFISPAGSLVATPFPVAPAVPSQKDVLDVEFDGTNFLVVWATTNGLRGQFVSPTGQPVGANLTLTAASIRSTQAGFAFGGGQYLVVWLERNGAQFVVRGRVVSPSGAIGGVFTLSQNGPEKFNPVNVVYGAGRFMVMWHYDWDDPLRDWDLRGRMVANGVPVGDELVLADGANDQVAFGRCLVFEGRYFLAVWTDSVGIPPNSVGTVRGRYWDTDGMPVTAPFTIAEAMTGGLALGLSAGSGKVFAIVHDRAFTDEADLCAKFVTLLPAVGPLFLVPGAVEANMFHLELRGPAGATAVVEASSNLTDWSPVSTNTLPTGPLPLVLPTEMNSFKFFRGRLP